MLERELELGVDGVDAVEREGLEGAEGAGRGLFGAVVGEDAVGEGEPARFGELRWAVGGEDLQAELDVAEETALVAEFDRGSVGELADLAEVVDDRGGDEEVAVEAGVQLAELPAELGDGDGVLDEAAEVGVVATARAGGAAQRGA